MEHTEATWKGVADVVGSEPSFEDFFELEQERLLRVSMVTGSLQEAEDIVQDTFIRVWERWPRVSAMESPTGYLHHAAMNTFRNRYRRAPAQLRRRSRPLRQGRVRIGRGPDLGRERPGEAHQQAAGRARADRPPRLPGG